MKKFEKKHWIIIIILILTYALASFLFWRSQNPIEYLRHSKNGNYNTIMMSASYEDGVSGKVIYCDGRYLFYDETTKAVCDCLNGDIVFHMEDTEEVQPDNIALFTNGDYIYGAVHNRVYQYELDGTLVGEIAIRPEKEDVSESFYYYAGKDQIYVFTDHLNLAVLNASNISKKVNVEYTIDNNINAAPFVQDEDDPLKRSKIIFPDITIYYEGEMYLEDNQNGLLEFKVDAELYKPVLIQKDTGKQIVGDIWKPYYVWVSEYKDGFITIEDEGIFISDAKDEREKILDFQYNYSFSKYKKEGAMLMILEEKYHRALTDSIYPIDFIGDYIDGKMIYYNLETGKKEQKYRLKDEQLICMDKEGYVTFKEGELFFYRCDEDQPVHREMIDNYKTGKEEERLIYYIQECYGKIFVFCEDKLIDWVDIPETK